MPTNAVMRSPRRPVRAAVLLIASLLPGAALAAGISMTGGKVVRFQKMPVPYHLHPACSADLAAVACLDTVRKSFQAWEGKSCSYLKFQDAGTSSNLKLISAGFNENGKNEVAWIENSVWTYGKYVLGVTSPLYYTSGKDSGMILEADIAMNGYQQTWSLSGKAYSTDVMNVAVHEIGHFFGLQHNLFPSQQNPETMAPTADPLMGSRTPEQDDIDGLCFLYPTSGAFACQSNAQCPKIVDDGPQGEVYVGQISCQSGKCAGAPTAVTSGDVALGQPCASDENCATPLFCQPISASQAVCSKLCKPGTGETCPAPFSCVPYQSTPSKGACIAAGGGGGSKDIGAPCGASAECKSQLCVSGPGGATCQQPCSAQSACPTGQLCQFFAGKTYGACGAAPPPEPAKLADGQPCTASIQCASALCVGSGAAGTCLADCTAKPCASGFACVGLQSGKGACFPGGDAADGAACQSDLDCKSGLCAANAGAYQCAQPCGAAKPCPQGLQCFGTTSGGACFAPQPKAPVGGTCEASADCQSGLCVQESDTKTVCSQPCATDAQCGVGKACAPLVGGGGACFALGSGKPGASCDDPFACQSGKCVDFGKGYVCAVPCQGAVDCGCGEQCQDFGSGKLWCRPGAKVACVAEGATCGGDSECISELCLAGVCAPSCSIFAGESGCAAGKGCVRLQADKPAGTCAPPGSGGFGAACSGDAGCVSLFCHAGTCGRPCQLFGPHGCPFGMQCEAAAGSVGRCVMPAPPAGEDVGGGGDAGAGGEGPSDVAADSGGALGDTSAADVASGGDTGATLGDAVADVWVPGLSGGSDAPAGGGGLGCAAGRQGRGTAAAIWLLALAAVIVWRRPGRRAQVRAR